MPSDSQSIIETPNTARSAAQTANPASSSTAVFQPAYQQDMRVVWARRIAAGLAVLLVGASAAAYGAWASWERTGTIVNGIIIAGEPVGGLTKAAAKERLQQRFGRLFVEVQTPDRGYKLSLSQLGGQPKFDGIIDKAFRYGRDGNPIANVVSVWRASEGDHRMMLPVEWDKNTMRRTMWTVASNYNKKPKDATLIMGSNGMEVVPEEAGSMMNVGATLANLQKSYFIGLPAFKAVTTSQEPRVTAASLDGTDVEMGRYTTYFDSGLGGRTRNIRVASNEVDGTILMPGESFSFNRATGERTWEKGYRMAHIFERKPGKDKSEVVDGLAGGVCQVSSTLFNAVRKANKNNGKVLKIVERTTHSLPVTYVPTGLDATVAWPSKDFRFRNSFAYPVYLRAVVSGSKLKISVWGRVPHHVAASMQPKPAPATTTSGAESPV